MISVDHPASDDLPAREKRMLALLDALAGKLCQEVSRPLGTLIGADLLNLGSIRGLGAPVASIGGAGTFDGIFLIGIVAVLIASLSQSWSRS